MTKEKTILPIEGDITRPIDLNLKKDDILLLITEGRKEELEKQLVLLTNTWNSTKDAIAGKQENFLKAIKSLVKENISKETMDVIKSLSLEKENLVIQLSNAISCNIDYQYQNAVKMGEGTNSTFIKVDAKFAWIISMPTRATVFVKIGLKGTSVKKVNSALTVVGENYNPQTVDLNVISFQINTEEVKSLKEYKELLTCVSVHIKAHQEYASLKADYEIFAKGGARTKAQMIKFALSGDSNGQKILDVVAQASKGAKLLELKEK